ncbi:polymorphic toxin-type HINT domain-containing protein [Streptomyces sp. NBC_00210]|uniref:polymorphic toxin-type HINT domain-containing protein n=1 Tax=Streptomyces sp. NBC_00210 TaxID=2903636 RepID=UPI0032535232
MKQFASAHHNGRRVRRARGPWIRRVAAVVGFALLPGLVTPVASATESAVREGRPKPAEHRPDKVSPFIPKVDEKTAAVMSKTAEAGRADAARAKRDQGQTVSWPTAGAVSLNAPNAGTAKAAPGGLPLTLTPVRGGKGTKSPKAADSVKATVLDQKQAAKLGVKGVVLSVTGPATGGSAQLGIDYAAFASAYGGDWAGRLQVLRLPDCALKTPDTAKCRTRTPLKFTNHRKKNRIDAQLAFASAPATQAKGAASGQTMVLALAAGTKSGGGDYKATPLAASSTWEAGGSSGTFTWSYPLRTPPAAAGPAPDLKISYDSGTVDGRTASTNNQGTVIGEGFDITSSYVERKYGSCDDDGQADKFDLCWKYENASLVLNGKATELVKDDTSGQWRLKDDDASTVIHHSDTDGADNGDDNKEYWTVITGEGTKYHFGLNKLPGSTTQATQSVWTVPVFGDDAGEPGYTQSSTFAGRAEKQAWRWNLDYIEDTHGNASSYWYAAESNNYDMLGDDTVGTPYVRGGMLKEIRYGQRKDTLFASPAGSNRVLFDYAERCDKPSPGCDSLTEGTRDNWPDVPFDVECKADQKCTGNVGPAFYTRKRMTGITTQAWDAATPAYVPVDSWALKQTYLDPGDTGDSTDQSLWLSEIRHTGERGTAITLPPVKFGHEFRANRVDGNSDNILPLNKPRLYTITSETGAQTMVTYMQADCLAGQAKPKVDTNTRRCYPVYWSPNGAKEPTLDWFQKYPVAAVVTNDPRGGSQAVQHNYTYSGGGAWHYNDDPLTKEKERTWSIWRGFEKVTHVTGASGKTQSKTVSVYLRGMNGDRVLGADGKLDADQRKSVTVIGVKAPELTDSEQYAGFTRESVTYNGIQEVSGTVNDPWSKRTATQHKSYADTEAHFVRTGASHARTNITSSGTPKDRVRTTEMLYDAYGMAYQVEDKGADDVADDEKCTVTWFARNDKVGINSLVARVRTTAGICVPDALLKLPTDSANPGPVISDTATAYDSTTWSDSQEPNLGEARWTGRVSGYALGQPIWQKTGTITYDTLGRPLTVKDTNDSTITTSTYTPAAAGPLTTTTAANAKGHKTTTLVDFATGAVRKVTDPNGKITESEYDALGRVTQVWLADSPRLLNNSPNYVYKYGISATDLPWVSTATLKGDGSGYDTVYAIYDTLLRPRQVQTPSPLLGMTVAQTLYDERGLAASTQADIWASDKKPSSTIVQTDGGQPPLQTDTTYDGAGRAVTAVTRAKNVPLWTIDTTYTGDTVSTSAPNGGQATAVETDAFGQTVKRREYGGPKPTGTDFTQTSYTYTPAGQQATVTGPDQAGWSYTYDLFGRQTSATDPDKGTGTTKYNELDQAVSTTDARSKTLVSEYDSLGRKTGLWDGAKTDATKLAAWTFDTLRKGQQDTAVRYENGVNQTNSRAYTSKVTKYDELYRVAGSQLILPDKDPLVEAGVPQTLSFSAQYHLNGSIKQVSHPAVAGLAAEDVLNKYDFAGVGLQKSSSGTSGYLQSAKYTPYGDVDELVLGADPTAAKKLTLDYGYEEGTRRLRTSVASASGNPNPLQELAFKQDDAGNVTSILDTATQGGTSKADYQCFAYDGHRRLSEAWTPKTADCAASGRTTANLDGAASYWSSYTYNDAGQRKSETQHTGSGDVTTAYTYGTARKQPHPLAKTVVGTKTNDYAYDEAGNTTSRPGTQAQQTLTWNTEGKLVGTTEPAVGTTKPATGTSYLYDANGELLIRRNTTGDGDTVLYAGGNEVRLTTKGATKTLSGTRYYTAAGQTIAVRTATVGTAGTKLNFLAGDHHGTSSLAVDATTLAVTKRYTTPFGAPRGTKPTTWPDDKAFLGRPADTTTGLTHVGAREYDPGIGQFTSVDPLMELDKHQTLNGYSYGAQNPVTFSDVTGLGLACGGGPNADGCPRNSDGTRGNGRPSKIDTGGNSGDTGGTGTVNYNGEVIPVIEVHPGVVAPADWDRAEEFRDRLRAKEAKRCGFYGPTCLADMIENPEDSDQFIGALATLSLLKFHVCGEMGGCPKLVSSLKAALGSGAVVAVSTGSLGIRGAGGKNMFRRGPISDCTKCFLAGTDVLMADGSTKDIEDVKLGDEVLATDPQNGKTGKRKVTRLIVTEDDKHFNELTIATEEGPEKLTATNEHPFWSPSEKRWVEAGQLQPGMTLLAVNGTRATVQANRAYDKRARTYNFTVDDLHTYYVLAGATPVLVHNAGPCKFPWSSGRVSAGVRAIDEGRTSIRVGSRSEAEEILLGKFQGDGYRNAAGFDGKGTRQYFGSKSGTYHWDDQLGADGRVLGHGAGNRDGDLPHLQIHTFEDSKYGGSIIRIFWKG